MNNKALIKLIIIFTISIVITYLLHRLVPIYFSNFTWGKQEIISCFTMILIIVNIVYNAVNNNSITALSGQLLAWGGIFLVIIIGYAFRFELNYVTQRVISVIIPSYNWVNTGELVISRNNDGHFYINALVNGVEIKFMIDTGASDVALTTKDASSLKFDLSKLNYNKTYSTANGTSSAALIILDSVKIGDGIFKNVEAHVGTGGLDISLLGMSVLERFKIFKIDRDILILSY